MPLTLKQIIFLLTFALLIQNTCPHGFAGKTALAPTCSHCPMKQRCVTPAAGLKNIASDSSSIHFPMFVFAMPKTIHTVQLEPIESAGPVPANGHEDALPDELLRPPRA